MIDFEKDTIEWASKFRGSNTNVPIMDLDRRLRIIENIMPKFALFTKYPALAEAYREYKLIEKLVSSTNET